MEQKFYGVFHFCFNSSNTDAKREIAYNVWRAFIDPEQFALAKWGLTSKNGVYTDKNVALNRAFELREYHRQDRKHEYAVYSVYKDKVVVHACDRTGLWIPTKKELKEAEEYAARKWAK